MTTVSMAKEQVLPLEMECSEEDEARCAFFALFNFAR